MPDAHETNAIPPLQLLPTRAELEELIRDRALVAVVAERARITTWLRRYDLADELRLCRGDPPSAVLLVAADAIDRGEHEHEGSGDGR